MKPVSTLVGEYLINMIGIEFTSRDVTDDLLKEGHKVKVTNVSSAITNLVRAGYVSNLRSEYVDRQPMCIYVVNQSMTGWKPVFVQRPNRATHGRSQKQTSSAKGSVSDVRQVLSKLRGFQLTVDDVVKLNMGDGTLIGEKYPKISISYALNTIRQSGCISIVGTRSGDNGRLVTVYEVVQPTKEESANV